MGTVGGRIDPVRIDPVVFTVDSAPIWQTTLKTVPSIPWFTGFPRKILSMVQDYGHQTFKHSKQHVNEEKQMGNSQITILKWSEQFLFPSCMATVGNSHFYPAISGQSGEPFYSINRKRVLNCWGEDSRHITSRNCRILTSTNHL